jgi:hypothetical protein
MLKVSVHCLQFQYVLQDVRHPRADQNRRSVQGGIAEYVYERTIYRQAVAYRVGGGGVKPPKFRSFYKAEPNSLFRGKYMSDNLIRIRVSLVCKLSGTPD